MRQLLIILLILTLKPAFGHEFFISIAEMEYDSSKNRINVSLRMTAHDFERVMEYKLGKEISLEQIVDSSAEAQFIKQYLDHNFKLYSNEEQLKMSYLGFEVNNRDELRCYFYFSDVPEYYTIKIINKLLFSLSDQQQNIVHYTCSGRTKSVTLIASKYEEWITFKEHEDD